MGIISIFYMGDYMENRNNHGQINLFKIDLSTYFLFILILFYIKFSKNLILAETIQQKV